MRNCLIFILLLLIGCQEREPSFLKLHSYIGNHAVFQRNEPITICGQTSPNTNISGNLGKLQSSSISNEEGKFVLTFTSLEAQTGLTLEIESSDSTAIFNDIAIGDVWFASGQSNMEWALQKTDNSNEVIQSSNLPDVRFFKTPKTIEFVSIDSLREEVNWIKGDEKEIGDISGVAYYFARKIHQETNVPIGVVVSSWGGTRIESWMSDKAIGAFDNLVEEKKSIAQIDKSIAEIEAFNKQILDDFLNEVFPKGIGMDEKWYLPQEDLSDWKEIHVPGYWEDQVPEYSSFDGAMWYRRKFDLQPEHYQNGDIRMWLSQIDDDNQVWINGEFIGETYYKDSWTNYLIPQEVLKEKDNEIVMRVFDIGGKGGTTAGLLSS